MLAQLDDDWDEEPPEPEPEPEPEPLDESLDDDPAGTRVNGLPPDFLTLLHAELVEYWTADWRRDANCADTDPDIMFPVNEEGRIVARAICARCLVREECGAAGEEIGAEYGMWGGRDRESKGDAEECRECGGPVPPAPAGLRRPGKGALSGAWCSALCYGATKRRPQRGRGRPRSNPRPD